jgi:ArsR family transcriptional regulator
VNNELKEKFEVRAQILKAMAHASRLCIISELATGERCVCQLTELIGADISTVSRHLSILKNAGFITSEKRGNQVFYSLKCLCIDPFFQCIESVLQNSSRSR